MERRQREDGPASGREVHEAQDEVPNQQDAPAAAAILLDFDTWIELAPRLMDLPMRDKARVLDERGIDLGDWLHSDKHHLAAIAADAAARRMERPQAYALRCAEEMERRERAAGRAGGAEGQGSR